MKSLKDLFLCSVLGGAALALGGCASINGRTSDLEKQKITAVPAMRQAVAVYDPCNSVGIEAVPATYLHPWEHEQNRRAGREARFHNGYYLFSKEPNSVKFGEAVGFIIGAVVGSKIGGGGARAITGSAGAVGGAMLGEKVGAKDRVEYLTDLSACRAFLNSPAPIINVIDGAPADRPINTPPKVFDNNSNYAPQRSRGFMIQ